MNERIGITCWVGPPWLLHPALALQMGSQGPERMSPFRGQAWGQGRPAHGEPPQAGRDLLVGDLLESLSLVVEGRLCVSRPPWRWSREQNLGSSQECHHDALICTAQSRRARQRGTWGLLWDRVCSWGPRPACPPTRSLLPGHCLLWAPPPTAGKSGYLQRLLVSSRGWGGRPETRTHGSASPGGWAH